MEIHLNSFKVDALRVLVIMHYLFDVRGLCPWHLTYAEFRGSPTSHHWIPCIAGTAHCWVISRLPVINGIDVRCWNVFWPMSTADSREYRLLPSNTTRPNMHKTNAGLRAPAEGANCLCNKKADTFLLWLQRLSILSWLMQLTYSFAFFKTKIRSFLL